MGAAIFIFDDSENLFSCRRGFCGTRFVNFRNSIFYRGGWKKMVDKLRTLFEQLRHSKKKVEVDRDLFSLIVDVVDELKADISFSNGCRRVFGSVNL
jgi:hypothetical protein